MICVEDVYPLCHAPMSAAESPESRQDFSSFRRPHASQEYKEIDPTMFQVEKENGPMTLRRRGASESGRNVYKRVEAFIDSNERDKIAFE